jgi:hypothetical protein
VSFSDDRGTPTAAERAEAARAGRGVIDPDPIDANRYREAVMTRITRGRSEARQVD